MDDRNITSDNFDYDMYSGGSAKELLKEYEEQQRLEKEAAEKQAKEQKKERYRSKYSSLSADELFDTPRISKNAENVPPYDGRASQYGAQTYTQGSAQYDDMFADTSVRQQKNTGEKPRPAGYGRRNPDVDTGFKYDPNLYGGDQDAMDKVAEMMAHERAQLRRNELDRQRRRNAGMGFYSYRGRGLYMTDEEYGEFTRESAWYLLWFIGGICVARLLSLPLTLYLVTGSVVAYVGALVKRNGIEKMSMADAVANSRKELLCIVGAVVLTLLMAAGF